MLSAFLSVAERELKFGLQLLDITFIFFVKRVKENFAYCKSNLK